MITLLSLLLFVFAEPSQKVQKLGPVEVGKSFPSFGGYTSTNTYVSFKKSIGLSDWVVVSYFATWCEPCIKSLPVLDTFIQKNQNVRGFYIALETKSSKVQQFANRHQVKTPIVLDKFKILAKRHGVIRQDGTVSLPKTFLIDSHGVVVDIIVSEGDDFLELLEKRVNSKE